MVERQWREPRPRPEQRPTVNVAVIGIEYVAPEVHHMGRNDYSLEIAPGVALHGDIHSLERIAHDAHKRCIDALPKHEQAGL